MGVMRPEIHRKSAPRAPEGYVEWEAAGLRWLAAAPDGAAVVPVLDVGAHHLDLARLDSARPDRRAARAFGAALARTHGAGAAAYGCEPDRWSGDGFFGPASEPLPLRLGVWPSWGAMYAEARVEPMVRLARDRGAVDAADVSRVDDLCARLVGGDFDDEESPARIHGDLWSGNLMWTPEGAVLIDPAAHGGHRETDLALLALFDCPYLEEVVDGYHEEHVLVDDWRDRVALHQVHCLLVHTVLFGGAYRSETMRAVNRYV
jgi:fructosamine-3-kinase